MTLPDTNPLDRPLAGAWAWLALLIALSLSSSASIFAVDGLVDPIKHALSLSDVEMSFILGWAYVGVFSLASLPAGALVDRGSRRLILLASVLLWGAGAVCCALARSYGAFCVGRALVGLGYASLGPATMSLLAGAFPTRLRARVFGAALAAWGVGPGIGLTASGLLLGLAEHVPGFHLEAWRLAILGCAVPAFLLAPLLLFMREPPRTPAPRPESRSGGSATPWGPLAVTLLAIIAITVSDGAQLSWSVAALVREHAVPPATAARNAGYVFFFCGAAAPVFAGTLADRLYRSQGVGGRLIVAIAAILLLIPLQALYGVSGADQLLMVIVGTGCTVVTGEVVGAAVLQDITPDSRRGLAAAANGLCSSLAIGVGTSGVALAARGHPGAPHGTTDAMSLVTVPASALALLVFIWLWRVMRNRRTGTPSVQGVAETAAAPLPLRS